MTTLDDNYYYSPVADKYSLLMTRKLTYCTTFEEECSFYIFIYVAQFHMLLDHVTFGAHSLSRPVHYYKIGVRFRG